MNINPYSKITPPPFSLISTTIAAFKISEKIPDGGGSFEVQATKHFSTMIILSYLERWIASIECWIAYNTIYFKFKNPKMRFFIKYGV